MFDLPIIVLLHGMGSHEPCESTKTCVEAIKRTLNQIHGFKIKSIERMTEIEKISYSDFLDEIREKMTDCQTNRLTAVRDLSEGYRDQELD